MRLLAGILAAHPFTAAHGRRRIAVAASDAPGDGAARADGRPDRVGRRPAAADDPRRTTARHCLSAPKCPSAQVKSAVLLAGLHAEGVTSVTEPAADPRSHRARAAAFGGVADVNGLTVSVGRRPAARRPVAGRPRRHLVGRLLVVAAAAFPGSRVEIEDVGLNPTRTALLDVLRRFGAASTVARAGRDARRANRRGTVVVEHDRTGSVDDRARRGARPHRRTAGHRGARGPRRRGRGQRRGRAARQGKRPHHGAGRRIPRAGHRRRRAARRLPRRAAGRRRRQAASPMRRAITGWRWPLRSPRSPPKGRRPSTAPTRSPSRTRGSSTRSSGSCA